MRRYKSLGLSSVGGFGSLKSLGHLLPVDDLPHLLQENRAQVLVIQVVSVLPNVNGQKGSKACANIGESVLVLSLAVL